MNTQFTRTPSTATVVDRPDANLSEARADVKAELARTDAKASLLLAFNGAVLAGLLSVATGVKLPSAALAVGAVGAELLVTAAVILLSVVRPRLGGNDRASFPHWARLDGAELREAMREDRRAEVVGTLSRIAVAKFRRLQWAVDLTRAVGAALTLAALLAFGGVL